MTHIEIDVDTSGAQGRLRRLAAGPGMDDLLLFEQALTVQYLATQAQVHVQTRSLKTSGRTDSDYADQTWSGTLTYGGPAPGAVYNPVRYAQVEQSRGGDKNGTAHDFMEPVDPIGDRLYVAAIEAFFRGTN
jgi:hypothetical protein